MSGKAQGLNGHLAAQFLPLIKDMMMCMICAQRSAGRFSKIVLVLMESVRLSLGCRSARLCCSKLLRAIGKGATHERMSGMLRWWQRSSGSRSMGSRDSRMSRTRARRSTTRQLSPTRPVGRASQNFLRQPARSKAVRQYEKDKDVRCT